MLARMGRAAPHPQRTRMEADGEEINMQPTGTRETTVLEARLGDTNDDEWEADVGSQIEEESAIDGDRVGTTTTSIGTEQMSNEQLIDINLDTLKTANPLDESVRTLLRTLQSRLRMKYNRSEAQYKKNKEKERREGEATLTRGEVEDIVTKAVGKALEEFSKLFPHQVSENTGEARPGDDKEPSKRGRQVITHRNPTTRLESRTQRSQSPEQEPKLTTATVTGQKRVNSRSASRQGKAMTVGPLIKPSIITKTTKVSTITLDDDTTTTINPSWLEITRGRGKQIVNSISRASDKRRQEMPKAEGERQPRPPITGEEREQQIRDYAHTPSPAEADIDMCNDPFTRKVEGTFADRADVLYIAIEAQRYNVIRQTLTTKLGVPKSAILEMSWVDSNCLEIVINKQIKQKLEAQLASLGRLTNEPPCCSDEQKMLKFARYTRILNSGRANALAAAWFRREVVRMVKDHPTDDASKATRL